VKAMEFESLFIYRPS